MFILLLFYVSELYFLLAYHWNIVSQLGADALHAAISAVSKYGGASLGYRTLLDALIPAATCLKEVSMNINVMFFSHWGLSRVSEWKFLPPRN